MLRSLFAWAGGKHYLSRDIISLFPDISTVETYIEPFVGAGSVFWKLRPAKAIINDANGWLMLTYFCIKHDVRKFIKKIKLIDTKFQNSPLAKPLQYQALVVKFNKLHSTLFVPHRVDEVCQYNDENLVFTIAALYFFLCKMSFGGTQEVDDQGNFKAGGGYTRDIALNENLLYNSSDYLNEANIKMFCGDYSKVLSKAKRSDLIYLDPPYLNNLSNDRAYCVTGFSVSDYHELFERLVKLNNKNIRFALSCSAPGLQRFNIFNQYQLVTKRLLGRSMIERSSNREELLITNF